MFLDSFTTTQNVLHRYTFLCIVTNPISFMPWFSVCDHYLWGLIQKDSRCCYFESLLAANQLVPVLPNSVLASWQSCSSSSLQYRYSPKRLVLYLGVLQLNCLGLLLMIYCKIKGYSCCMWITEPTRTEVQREALCVWKTVLSLEIINNKVYICKL